MTGLQQPRDILVVNDVKDKLGAVLCSGVPYKIIAVPVQDGGSEVGGMLVIARSYAEPRVLPITTRT